MKVDPLRFPVFLQVSYTNTKPRASAIRGRIALLESFGKFRIKDENEVNTSFHKIILSISSEHRPRNLCASYSCKSWINVRCCNLLDICLVGVGSIRLSYLLA